jgi:hypothetical protein
MLFGAGFLVDASFATQVFASDASYRAHLRPFRNGKDLTSRPRALHVIDFEMLEEAEAREWPLLFDIVRDKVRPEREANARAQRVRYWWRFGEPNTGLRSSLAGIRRYIVTPETSKHRFFVFLDSSVAPDNALVCIASEGAFLLGCLSSAIHKGWALAVGGALEDKPRYNKRVCFDPFPFPVAHADRARPISEVAERLDAHRAAAIARDERVTMTGMYNVVEKLRANDPLTPKERTIHELAACGVLRDMHDELDKLVAEAYGWPWPMGDEEILERLVALHDERVAEEAQGIVRWLRPEYQAPNEATSAVPAELALSTTASAKSTASEIIDWPTQAIEQIAAIKRLASAGPVSIDHASAAFRGAKREIVARHLETLAILGEVRAEADGRFVAASS